MRRTKAAIKSLMHSWNLILISIERFLTGSQWRRLKVKSAERRLEIALDQHGNASFEVRRAHAAFRRADFAFKFGRPAHMAVEMAVRKLSGNGIVPPRALWVLIVNRDIQATPRGVSVRRAWWAKPFKYFTQGIVVAGFAYLSLYTIFTPGSFVMKLGILAVLALIHSFVYIVWRIYTVLPVDIVERYGDKIDSEIRHQSQPALASRIRPVR